MLTVNHHVFLKEYILFVRIKSTQDSPLKHVLVLIRLIKFWVFINFTMKGLAGSELKYPNTTLLPYIPA